MNIGTFRQRAMIAAMQGLMSNTEFTKIKQTPKQIAAAAVELADALLEANMAPEMQEEPIT